MFVNKVADFSESFAKSTAIFVYQMTWVTAVTHSTNFCYQVMTLGQLFYQFRKALLEQKQNKQILLQS